MDFEGEFETHITVRALDADGIDSLRVWAESYRLSFNHIVLERGKSPSQPMVGRRGHGGLSGELAVAEELSHLLNIAGFKVSRIKVEAAPWNTDIPISDADSVNHPGRYFEHHVKLALEQVDDLTALTALALANSAHLSRNARRVREDGRQERFVTQRCHAVGRFTARSRLDSFLAALLADKHEVLSVEEEFVVYDSAPGIDAGWIDEGVEK